MQRWQQISTDPNDQELLDQRRTTLAKARTKTLIYDRVDYLCRLVAGKSVLDIGVVEHNRIRAENPQWLHANLRRHAARCIGVDVLADEVSYLNRQGYEILVADITQSPLPYKFDVIIGGEVLEHLDLPGIFMRNCAAMLKPNGCLAITVPNPWYINAILKSVSGRSIFVDSADHVAWYEASTLFELAQRHGLTLNRYSGIAVRAPTTPRARFFFGLQPLYIKCGLAPELFAKSMLYEFVWA